MSEFSPARSLAAVRRAFALRQAVLRRQSAELAERAAQFGDRDGGVARAIAALEADDARLRDRLRTLDGELARRAGGPHDASDCQLTGEPQNAP